MTVDQSIPDVAKDKRYKAFALEVHARQAKNVEAERRACQIPLRAERKVVNCFKRPDEWPARVIRGESAGRRGYAPAPRRP